MGDQTIAIEALPPTQVDSEWVRKNLLGCWTAVYISPVPKEIHPSIVSEFALRFKGDSIWISDCANSTYSEYSLSTDGLSGTLKLKGGNGWTERGRMWPEKWQGEQGDILDEYIHKFARSRTVEFRLSEHGDLLTLSFEESTCKFNKS